MDIAIEPAGGHYIDICVISRKKTRAVLSLKAGRDASKALQQIVDKNYRNQEGLPNIGILREYLATWPGPLKGSMFGARHSESGKKKLTYYVTSACFYHSRMHTPQQVNT